MTNSGDLHQICARHFICSQDFIYKSMVTRMSPLPDLPQILFHYLYGTIGKETNDQEKRNIANNHTFAFDPTLFWT